MLAICSKASVGEAIFRESRTQMWVCDCVYVATGWPFVAKPQSVRPLYGGQDPNEVVAVRLAICSKASVGD